jgi:hypothetical protein
MNFVSMKTCIVNVTGVTFVLMVTTFSISRSGREAKLGSSKITFTLTLICFRFTVGILELKFG